ncbi:MAG: hypothetical protein KGQ51_11170 [Planctomycetes bacterium]|nr:hypothetical protein [Planctomycetota bacterium]
MNNEGPSLAAMTHRLAECPEEFLSICDDVSGSTCVIALLTDFFRRFDDHPMRIDDPFIAKLGSTKFTANHQRHLGLLSLAVWLFYDPWFSDRKEFAVSMWNLLTGDNFQSISGLLKPRTVLSNPDRREELVRVCLSGLDLRPAGESIPQATDRLMSLNSIERERILKETAAAEKRAREVREAMARIKAQESVSRYTE